MFDENEWSRGALDELEHWEARTNYLYLDTRGNVTVGIGCLVSTSAHAAELEMRATPSGRPATRDEKIADFERVAAMKPGRPAHAYKTSADSSALYLNDDAVTAMALSRLRLVFLPGLRRLLPAFDGFPDAAKAALVDLAWNLGIGGLARFRKLIAACNAGDWLTAARECSVATSRESRNAWRSMRFLAASRGQ